MVMANDSTRFMKSSAVSDVFIVLFTFLAHLDWLYIAKVIAIAKCSSFALPLHACSSPVVEYFTLPTPNFVQFEQCTSYQRSRRILSRRQHAPNKRSALNSDERLITRFYSIFEVLCRHNK